VNIETLGTQRDLDAKIFDLFMELLEHTIMMNPDTGAIHVTSAAVDLTEWGKKHVLSGRLSREQRSVNVYGGGKE
jgi:hypothetical protein